MVELPAVKQFVSDTGVRIYRIPFTFMPAMSGRVYLVLEAGPPALVDAGTGQDQALHDILVGLETVRSEFDENVRLSDIRRFFITHAHSDHMGGLWRLVSQTNAEVFAHPLDARRISAVEERGLLADKALGTFLRQAGVSPQERSELVEISRHPRSYARSVPVDRLIEDGQEIDGLRFLHTPGHSPGHVCIRAGNILLCGDHVLSRTVSQQWPESTAAYTGLGHYLDSLRRLRGLTGIELGLGGHEPPIHHFYQRLNEVETSHLRRLDRLMEILRSAGHPMTVQEMARQMYAVQKGFHTMLALTDVGSRVEYLDLRGHLAIDNLDEVDREGFPVYRYRPA